MDTKIDNFWTSFGTILELILELILEVILVPILELILEPNGGPGRSLTVGRAGVLLPLALS